jgi:K+-transporting ATPase KdpF subunit
MSAFEWIALALCFALALYLFAALLRPEFFD